MDEKRRRLENQSPKNQWLAASDSVLLASLSAGTGRDIGRTRANRQSDGTPASRRAYFDRAICHQSRIGFIFEIKVQNHISETLCLDILFERVQASQGPAQLCNIGCIPPTDIELVCQNAEFVANILRFPGTIVFSHVELQGIQLGQLRADELSKVLHPTIKIAGGRLVCRQWKGPPPGSPRMGKVSGLGRGSKRFTSDIRRRGIRSGR